MTVIGPQSRMWKESFVRASRGSLLILPLGRAASLHLLMMNIKSTKMFEAVVVVVLQIADDYYAYILFLPFEIQNFSNPYFYDGTHRSMFQSGTGSNCGTCLAKARVEKSKHGPLDRRPSEGGHGEDEWYSRRVSAGESWQKKAGQR